MRPDQSATRAWGRSAPVTDRVLLTLEKFLHIEALSGAVLIAAAAIALLWANSPYADSYHALWHTEVSIGVGSFSLKQSLHFIVNDMLMTVFFLVAGLEIRRELHEGALSRPTQATLPLVTALGGVAMPALIYMGFNIGTPQARGWAVPMATDIAFAVGVLALLGKSIPGEVRALLLALAIVDDVFAIVVIALFYSQGLQPLGALLGVGAILVVLLWQRLGIRSAWAYALPGTLLWIGMWWLGVHPTLAGVLLGLLTPVMPLHQGRDAVKYELEHATQWALAEQQRDAALIKSLKAVQSARRDLIPPVVDVQTALHPWVAFVVMPLFALANAGVTIGGGTDGDHNTLIAGIVLGLLIGKPVGIVLAGFIGVRLGVAALPASVGWQGLTLVGLLGGIGFTMSIFIAGLAFVDTSTLDAAKLAVLSASALSALLALGYGAWWARRGRT